MARRMLVLAGAGLLVLGTVLVFRAFDHASHSASDTLRPFLLTTAPVWAVAAAVVLHGGGRGRRSSTGDDVRGEREV